LKTTKRALKLGTIVAVAVAATVVAGSLWMHKKRQPRTPFKTAAVTRGDLVAVISATGTVEPVAVVDIGAQVAGVISSFGTDIRGKPVDWGSPVDAGTVLARIDDRLYAAAVDTARAQLEQNEANKISADANVLQMKAKLVQAQADWTRAQKLGPSDALSQSAYDQYRANYEVAKANVDAAEAAVNQTKAAVELARANLKTAQINLDYCTIKSPVKAVVIDRRVNIGQTVVSSLSAPSLFLIASDLKRIQVWVSVNEADIGSISEGQPATFTVDAYPNQVFHGKVDQVRLNATMTQNVVTYTVAINTDNKDGKLLPYLTANAQFQIGRRHDVLMVPSTALHWSPRPNQIAPDFRQRSGHRERSEIAGPPQTGRIAPESRQGSASRDHASEIAGPRGTVWVAAGRFVRPLRVKTGLTDGANTEVEGGDLTEGLRVVVGESAGKAEEAPSSEDRNPFALQVGRGFRPDQGQPPPAPGGQR
jgi:HlyD family secretion protein